MEPNTLLVTISAARGLYLKNKTEYEAFATIVLQGKGSLRSRVTTEHVKSEGDCRWDETCEFKLNDKLNTVSVSVQNRSKIGSELIGKLEVSLEEARHLTSSNWFSLKKRANDDKYRGEVQLCFAFSYEKSTMSVSNMSLNKIEGKGGVLSKIKRKITAKHKQAEDTMSVASNFSAMSIKSNKSNRFFDKLKNIGGHKEKFVLVYCVSPMIECFRSATLAPGTFLPETHGHSFFNDSASMYESRTHDESRETTNRGFNPFDVSPVTSPAVGLFASSGERTSLAANNSMRPVTPNGRHSMNGGIASPAMSHAASLPRMGSAQSVASSGFESSKHQKHLAASNSNDLLVAIDSLKLELQVKDARMKDMQVYMDNLISRVMEKNPELLAAPVNGEKFRRRFF